MKLFRLVLLICMTSSGVFAGTLSVDGPYLFHLPDGGARVIYVDTAGIVTDTLYTALPKNFSMSVISHKGKHLFDVTLHPVSRPDWKQQKADKLLVMSDPHGNLECLASTLKANGVINDEYKWIYGANQLMIIGDVFDRGKDVLPIFWLIYKLEQEAQQAGGQVFFLLGNHEPMVLANDMRYAEKKYKELAEHLNMKYADFFAPNSELGHWLGTRNTLQLIGDELFVHAGLGKTFLEQNLSIPKVNEEISRALFMTKEERNELSPLTKFLYGNEGPIWYRGMVRNDEKYIPLYVATLDLILEKYQARRVIVGHTIFNDIRRFYNGKVIAVNVDNKHNFEKVLGRGILIENNSTYIIGDKEIMGVL